MSLRPCVRAIARQVWFDAMSRTGERAPASLAIVHGGPGEAIPLTRLSQDSASTVDCPAYLRDLNFAQRAAVEYGVSDVEGARVCGPLLVIAGARTGKTNTLAHRVAHLILTGTPPDRILLLTFSRRAAEEMTRRAQRNLGFCTGCVKAESPRAERRNRLGRHLPRHRQPFPPRVRRQHWTRSLVHRSRPRRFGRPS
jgi:UvrD/REP helicase N-terminal domain